MPGTSNWGSDSSSDRFRGTVPHLAIAALFCMLALSAQTPAALNQAGKQALSTGDLKTALARFQDAARLDPKNPQIQFNLGLTLARAGRPKDALPPLKIAAADSALSAEARYLLGGCYFILSDYSPSVEALQGLDQGPRADHVLYLLEESYRRLGRVPEAGEAFRQLNRRFPDSAWTHYLLGNAYEHDARLDQAIEEYKTALARDPVLPNARFSIGYLYWRQQDLDTAKSWFEQELARQPCHDLASFYLGQIARDGQDPKGAAQRYRQSLACEANSAEAHLRLGIALGELNQNAEALGELRRAAELAPDNPAVHYRLGLLYRKLGRTAESQAEYDTVRRLQAKDEKN
jgi:tetratricopeptide (TPR) repeat protein